MDRILEEQKPAHMESEEAILDARCYCVYIAESGAWGHGPIQVAEAVLDALDGKGLDDDCLGWLSMKAETPEGRAWLKERKLEGTLP